LRNERLIVTRQCSGAYVRAQTRRPVELRPLIEAAFEHPHVAIDFAGFSGETLRDAITEALDMVRAGRSVPETITVRLMISDMSVPMALPALAATGTDDPAVRKRAERIAPTFKLYMLNGREAFFGFYPAVKREVTIGREPVEIFDLMGRDATLFHYAVDEDEASHGTQFVESARLWFDSVWDSVAREYRS
jgi:hypothetical protein